MKRPLTLYALKPSVGAFKEALKPEVLSNDQLLSLEVGEGFDFGAHLYSVPVNPTEPAWAEFLREGFVDFTATPSAMSRVVILVSIEVAGQSHFFAASFGAGRFLLRTDSYQKKYGLRVALNAVYAGDNQDAQIPSERIRQVGVTRVAQNTIHTSRQANRNAAFGDFGVDLSTDLLNGVTGIPGDEAVWGRRITGSDSFRAQVIENFGELGDLCRQLLQASQAEDYKTRFGRIDDVRTVPAEELPELEEQILDIIKKTPDLIALAPPTILDFDQISKFRYSCSRNNIFDDLRFQDYLELVEAHDDLDLDTLRSHRIEALGDDELVQQTWSVYESMDMELIDNNRTILFVGGDFYAVATDVMEELNTFIDDIEESSIVLPHSTFKVLADGKQKDETEGAYNERAAKTSPEFALLDKKTVRIRRKADPIEVCDILTRQQQFVHVKRKFGSSSLSHLFAQGAVSADLFVRSDEYREKTRAVLKEIEEAPNKSGFQVLFPQGRPDPSSYEVVYAIIGKWLDAKPSQKLPFFSKVNLRRHTNDLRALGYKVSYRCIDLIAD